MKVAFRTDASSRIGTGHVVRCLSFASALRARGAECTFICRHVPDAHAALMEVEGIRLVRTAAATEDSGQATLGVTADRDADEVRSLLQGEHFDWLVVDHYALDARWERKLQPVADRLLVVDDLADRPHDCDVLLDQNFYCDMQQRYESRVAPTSLTLLGPRYALLGADFATARRTVSIRDRVRRILVFFGGIDIAGHTRSVINALASTGLKDLSVDVVVGAMHPFLQEIRQQCAAHDYRLHVQTTRMAELMAQADLAIGAGGSATWERCCVGLPSIVFTIADNQRQLVQDAARAGYIYAPDASPSDERAIALHVQAVASNPRLLAAFSSRGMSLVDGNGVQRVLQAMGITGIEIRRATSDDSRNMFEWRNHPEIRANSRSQAPVEWQAHLAWAQAALADSSRILLIGERGGQPIGVVRFDLDVSSAEVSIYVVPGTGGQRVGSDLLSAAEHWLSRTAPQIAHLSSEVLGDNEQSHGLFRSAGYARESTHYSKRLNR